jgi:hypothetical protein
MKLAELPPLEPYFDEAGRFIHPCRIRGPRIVNVCPPSVLPAGSTPEPSRSR